MQAKQYLKELKRLDTCIRHKIQEKDTLYNPLRAANTDGMKIQASHDGDSMTDLLIKIETIEAKINGKIDEYVNLKNKIIDQIHGLSNETFVDLLHRRYVEFKRLEEIAVDMNYTYQYVRELHGHALQEFDRQFSAEIAAYEEAQIARLEKDPTQSNN